MPKGDPAGYLPNVIQARESAGHPIYQPRSKRGAKPGEAKASAAEEKAILRKYRSRHNRGK